MHTDNITHKNNITHITIFAIILLFFNIGITVYASENNSDYQQSLRDYLTLPETASTNFNFIAKSTDDTSRTTKIEYSFISQVWPKTGPQQEQTKWRHLVNLYIPKDLKYDTALLWINGGTLYKNPAQDYNPGAYQLNFNQIAAKTNSIVIDLQDIPNQYLTLDNKKLAEDALVAFTWAKFVKDPENYRYYSAYLPMVKAVIKAIDNSQAINYTELIDDPALKKKLNNNFKINGFIVAGLSKRGMATWLASLHEIRIKAIIPIAIDILNTKANIYHIFQSHQGWPIAMIDYAEQKVLQNLDSSVSKYLMQINDPYQYIKCSECDHKTRHHYQKRAKIDKYLILASGDDFFVPDSTLFYYHDLPGNKQLRFIPNSRHLIDNKIVSDAILTYTYLFNNQKQYTARIVKSNLTKNITSRNKYTLNITTNIKPTTVTLYSAYNPKKRDFRLAEGIKYDKTIISPENFNQYIAKKKKRYKYSVSVAKPKKGWQAYFVELEYDFNNELMKNKIPNFKLTTPVNILPKNYPELIKAAIKNNNEAIVRYGNSVIYPIKQKLKNKSP